MGTSDGDTRGTTASLSQSIIEAVAERAGVDVTEVEPPEYEPLYTVVNPEALDDLFSSTFSDGDRGPGRVHLTYAGYDVTAFSDGRIELSEASPDESNASPEVARDSDEAVGSSAGN